MKYLKKLVGEKCYLAPIIYEDYEKFAEWFTDIKTAIGLGDAGGNYSVESTKGFFEQSFSNNSNRFSIVDLNEDKLIGFCWLKSIGHIDRSTELAILIGDENYRGKGYGMEAMNLIIDYCFNILNLHNVMVVAYSHNEKAIGMYKKIGFKEIGRRRESHFIGGKAYDEVYMDILPKDYKGKSVVDTYFL
ncbi:GNAT family N-acetyltransferase [Clostridium hydrogeniformans]|uniref:GNAT family N-acetyltransferase n=1 Tax=Clostridium hydrogeniformans TaxID=349933 RepID=UPI00047F282C|nr:GNAT family protein [Clostridium hydrogeniformans]